MFVYKVENAIFVRKQRNTVKNILNNVFVIYIIFKKKDINTL